MAEIGKRYRFEYPTQFTTLPAYTAHAGQTVTVLRALSEDEAQPPNEEEGITQMYEIQADDGWRGSAWDEELAE